MSDWQTVKQAILAEANRPNDSTAVERALCEALRFNRNQQAWFNEGESYITTVADQYVYDLPPDFLSMIGSPYFSASGSSARRTLIGRSRQFVEDFKYSNSGVIDDETDLLNGTPMYFATDARKIYLLPVPSEAGATVTFRYLRDMGSPYMKYSGSAWSVYDPDSNVALSATYTNPWLDEAQDVTRFRALYIYYNTLGNQEAAGAAMQQWLEALRQLRVRNTKAKGSVKVRGHF